ncbi:histidine kinase [Aureibaculum sp. A20]|uniref:Histidine kinase n=1 Tax=Aureibaculum flavum TaxID=2795986 RepID=A0ABS0WQ85_9FLAO|nr:histidine kinase [Aureibaculum flavum]MBJ2174140.1 histidine kinase [Aureibaculum flavum]
MLFELSSELYAWIRGGLLFAALYSFLFFILNKRKQYLYYSLFLLCFFLYYLKNISYGKFDLIYDYINYPLLLLGLASYIAFGRDVLETKKKIPEWDRMIVLAMRSTFIIAFVFIGIQFFFGHNYQDRAFIFLMPIIAVFSVLTYFVLTKIEGKHVTYFIIGSVSYLTLAIAAYLLKMAFDNEHFMGLQPKLLMYLGALIEMLMTALLIGNKLKTYEKNKVKIENELVIKTKEMNDLKMTILQTQMDPHFLYNSLNSINNFVLQHDKEKASDYITKFSRLIREVLKNSTSLTIPLEDDLGILGLYIKLEQMRMIGGFDYIVTIDEGINLRDIQVPPLFMQPYIENAIWHGFNTKKNYKRISLSIYDEEDNIRCEIIDNGVGIKESQAKRAKYKSDRKPFGLKASEDRIKLLHENQKVYVIIEDISDHNNTGTKVTIKFPKKIL